MLWASHSYVWLGSTWEWGTTFENSIAFETSTKNRSSTSLPLGHWLIAYLVECVEMRVNVSNEKVYWSDGVSSKLFPTHKVVLGQKRRKSTIYAASCSGYITGAGAAHCSFRVFPCYKMRMTTLCQMPSVTYSASFCVLSCAQINVVHKCR